jgi:hypothetical protein
LIRREMTEKVRKEVRIPVFECSKIGVKTCARKIALFFGPYSERYRCDSHDCVKYTNTLSSHTFLAAIHVSTSLRARVKQSHPQFPAFLIQLSSRLR